MSTITLDPKREGLAGFPAAYEPIGHDDVGDPLAVDAAGAVWSFQHGAGDWSHKTLAFRSLKQVEQYVAFQANFSSPDDEGLDALRERKQRIEQFAEQQRDAPYTRMVAAAVLAELREAIGDRRFWRSRRGTSVAERQALGQRCEQVLRAAGAGGVWMVRAHAEQDRTLVVVGPFAEPWTEAAVRTLLEPLLGKGCELLCRAHPSR